MDYYMHDVSFYCTCCHQRKHRKVSNLAEWHKHLEDIGPHVICGLCNYDYDTLEYKDW